MTETKQLGSMHIDKRARQLIADARANDLDDADMLKTKTVAMWLGVSKQFLEIQRFLGGGPRFTKVGRLVLYRRGDLLEWLEMRSHYCTAEYTEQARVLRGSGPSADELDLIDTITSLMKTIANGVSDEQRARAKAHLELLED